MILKHYINSDWLQNSFSYWAQRCQNAHSAESVEMLKEVCIVNTFWEEVLNMHKDIHYTMLCLYPWSSNLFLQDYQKSKMQES